MTRRPSILLIDRDRAARDRLCTYLSDGGYEVRGVRTAAEIDWAADRGKADLVVLNLDRSDDDGGLDLVRHLRDAQSGAVLALSDSTDPIDRIAGLETGADDFVVKPVDDQELAARIGGILERRGIGRRDIVRLERATVDMVACRLLRFAQEPERLGPGEIMLIRAFAQHPNRILTRDDLLDMAAAESLDAADRSIDTRVARLRRKLDTEAIVTVRGSGYMFIPPFEVAAKTGHGHTHPDLAHNRAERS